jgi:hypothetical protein
MIRAGLAICGEVCLAVLRRHEEFRFQGCRAPRSAINSSKAVQLV